MKQLPKLKRFFVSLRMTHSLSAPKLFAAKNSTLHYMTDKKYFLLAVLFLASCTTTSVVKKTEPIVTEPPKTENELRVINNKLVAISGLCQSLYGEGTITLREGSSSQSGQFEMRSKRCAAPGDVDSLSMIVSGPFGITAAKFLGSSNEFHFVNVLQGEQYHGKPDPKTLEQLTGMKGLSLGLLNDLIYGISPMRLSDAELTAAQGQLLRNGKQRLFFENTAKGYSEAITLKNDGNSLKLYTYERWNRLVDTAEAAVYRADLVVTFTGSFKEEPYLLPRMITATSGNQTLEIEYSEAKENPGTAVKIKMHSK